MSVRNGWVPDLAQRNDPIRMLQVEKTLFLQSVTVWGGISGLGKTKLVFVRQEVEIDAELHLKQILEDAMIPWAG
ncbi:hypothetical protein Y032_0243g3469 [Ancylostoma ceylanicum]|uniref:Uncharacterized protein n=1 Tax=Ancylostoma ceylanicum TaxID=53326 RepID=A0A016SEC3_9BILA|nr:hypothetical protein Y032_0243g3469 [Ancylostoma ceylanicum]